MFLSFDHLLCPECDNYFVNPKKQEIDGKTVVVGTCPTCESLYSMLDGSLIKKVERKIEPVEEPKKTIFFKDYKISDNLKLLKRKGHEEIPEKIARSIIRKLNIGIPPTWSEVDYFDIKISDKLDKYLNKLLEDKLDKRSSFIYANPGFGKSHFLSNVKKYAYENQFNVVQVELNTQMSVRFNRFDQILESIIKNIRFTDELGGEMNFFDLLDLFYLKLTEGSAEFPWGPLKEVHDLCNSILFKRLIIAWTHFRHDGRENEIEKVIDIFSNVATSSIKRKTEFKNLLEYSFPRNFYEQYQKTFFAIYPNQFWPYVLYKGNYKQSWLFFVDILNLSKMLLNQRTLLVFEEFEDITNLKSKYLIKALGNLTRIMDLIDEMHGVYSLFVITPEFYTKVQDIIKKAEEKEKKEGEEEDGDTKYWLDRELFDSMSLTMDMPTKANKKALVKQILGIYKSTYDNYTDDLYDFVIDELEKNKYFAGYTIRNYIKELIDLIEDRLEED